MTKSLSLILCTKNAMGFLPSLIGEIGKQKNIGSFEFIIADTYSTDGSWEFLKNVQGKMYNVQLFQIKPKDFGHGKTRNELIKKAKGKIIVFISQDIKINDNLWLYHLIKPLENPKIGASFCRQIPYPDANIYDKFFYSRAYPNKDRIINGVGDLKFDPDTIFFSMVSAATKKNLLIKHPFVKGRDASIDQWFAKAVIEEGYKIQYVASTAVYHSHNYSLKELFKRNFYSGQSLIGFPKDNFLESIYSVLGYLAREAVFIWKTRGVKGIMGMVVYEATRIRVWLLVEKIKILDR